eukprot:scaffold385_cov305-Pinguiococcus_pyrenoidosus.AAC.4
MMFTASATTHAANRGPLRVCHSRKLLCCSTSSFMADMEARSSRLRPSCGAAQAQALRGEQRCSAILVWGKRRAQRLNLATLSVPEYAKGYGKEPSGGTTVLPTLDFGLLTMTRHRIPATTPATPLP